jgi:hypothetical protein
MRDFYTRTIGLITDPIYNSVLFLIAVLTAVDELYIYVMYRDIAPVVPVASTEAAHVAVDEMARPRAESL